MSGGSYSVTVTDNDSGCQANCSVTIGSSVALSCSIDGVDTSCGFTNGTAIVNVFDGGGNYSYNWSNGSTLSSLSGLSAGSYSVTVTDTDSGCQTSCSVVIGSSSTLSCSIDGADTSCGLMNGTASVNVFDGGGNYSYSWSNGSTSSSLSGLSGGSYSVTITDNDSGCQTSCSVMIGSSTALTCSIDGVDTSCGLSNGTASVNVFNGGGNYSYNWSNGSTLASLSGLSEGSYSVTVTDLDSGCQAICSVMIGSSAALSCTVDGVATSCGLNNGSASVNVFNGGGNYSYSWNNGSTLASLNGLSAGSYSVTVTDIDSGCQTSCSVIIASSTSFSCNVIGTDTSCGLSNGTASVNINGGSGSYSYSWSHGPSSQTVVGLSSGSYSVTVTDLNTTCTTVCSVTIASSNAISCSLNGTDTTCGLSNGTASVSTSGGSGNYSYSWSHGPTTQAVTGLSSGSYSVTVTDLNTSCTTTCSVTIGSSNAINCTINGSDTSCNLSNGTASVAVSGGSGNYSYSWSHGPTTQAVTGLSSGSYSVTVTDTSTSCTTSCSVTIASSNAISCSINETDTSCGLSNGAASVNVSGGSGNYSYSWAHGPTSQTLVGLSSGSYSVTVTDINTSCTTTCSVTIGSSIPISCTVNGTDTSCGLSNGAASVTVSGGSGNYSYSWSHDPTSQAVTGLSSGSYSVTVTDISTSCTTTCSVTIASSNPISCTINGTDTACGLSNGTAYANVSSGSGNYSFAWSNGANTQFISGLSSGSYSVTVTDNDTGCTTSCNVTIGSSSNLSCTTSNTNTSCGFSNGTASVNITGGSGNYSYNWSNGANTQSISNLSSGNYSVTVTDLSSSCTVTCSVTIGSSNPLSCSINGVDTSCGLENGSATAVVSNGTGNYSYNWSNGATTQSISNLPNGSYSVTVTDITAACSTSCTISIADSNSLTCSVTGVDAECDTMNGSASVSVSGGSGNYSYSWSNGATNQMITGLVSGSYIVTVTDDNTACTTTCTIMIQNVGDCQCPDPEINIIDNCDGTMTYSTPDLGPEFTYTWNFGTLASPMTATGIGPHTVTYPGIGTSDITLDVERICDNIIVPQECCNDFSGKPLSITFRYVGGGCSGTNLTQDPGKFGCSGNANDASPANIIIDDGSNVYFSGSVNIGDEFTASNGGNQFTSNTDYSINGQETGFFHTSCSQPLGVGDQIGSLLIIGMTFSDGTCGAGGSSQPDCCVTIGDKPTELTFTFLGGGCAEDNNSQGAKSDCTGGATGPGPYTWTAADGSTVFQSGTVDLDGTIVISDGGADLPNPTMIRINGSQEVIEIHTSCSAPIIMGERYGSLQLVGMVNGMNETCEMDIPCFDCTATKIVTTNVGGIDPMIEYTKDCDGLEFTFQTTDYGDTYDYTWDFGAGASPTTATGVGPHVVTYTSQATVNVSLDVVQVCEEVIVPQACCDDFSGRPLSITLKYVGGGCSGTNLTQDAGKFGCSGNANDASPANIIIDNGSTIYFSGSVNLGDEFTASNGGSEFSSNTNYSINGQETGFFHTSCSQPLGVGDRIGSLLIVAMEFASGTCDGTGGGSSGSDCCVLIGDKPTELTFSFEGGGCAADNNSQGSKSSCSGGVTGPGPYTWTAADGTSVFQSGTVSQGGSIVVYDGGADLPNPTMIRINGSQEVIEIHTSCSAPIVMGERYGSLQLIGMVNGMSETCDFIPPTPPCVDCQGSDMVQIITGFSCDISKIDASCGLPNGSATVNVSGGSGSFSYAWSSGGNAQTEVGLTGGTYTVTVTDLNDNCTTTFDVTINTTDAITCTISGVDATCGLANGSASVSVSGGSGNYSYNWSHGPITQFVGGLTAGTYTVSVTDNNTGCTTSCSITINSSNAISCTIDGTDTSCGLNNGSANVTVSGGTGTYAYTWSHGPTSQFVGSLSSGSYSVTVFDSNTGCSTTCSTVLTTANGPTCFVSGNNSTCGQANGSAAVFASGGTGPYTYFWSNGGMTPSISGLSAGTYTVTVTDNNGCSTTCSTTITSTPSPTCNVVGVNPDCGMTNGSVTVTASGGSRPYSYFWNTGATTMMVSNLGSGTYSVTVTDSNGCTTTCSTVLTTANGPTCFVSGNNSTCGQANGSAAVFASGGTGPYTYFWSNGGMTPSISGLSAGTYTVTVTDNNGCSTTCSTTITSTPSPTCNVVGVNPDCGMTNGSATVIPSGGVGPYTYFWSTGSTTTTVSNLGSGTYIVTVTDSNGCTTSCSTVLTTANGPTCFVTANNSTCGFANGNASAFASGGVGPYTYFWSTGATTQTIGSLTAGTYIVTVTDNNGCSTTCSTIISTTPTPTCTVTGNDPDCGMTNGSATVIPSGGVGPYTYFWSTGATTTAISNLGSGTYSVTVTDSNGCTTTCSTVLTTANGPTCFINGNNPSCGQSNGFAVAFASGGTGPYTYFWSTGATTQSIGSIAAGTYTVTVTDNNGCSTTCSTTLTTTPVPTCTVTGNDPDCGLMNGSATVIPSSGVGPYTYFWNTGATTTSISNLGAGTYTVTVTDSNGCTTSCSTVLNASNNLSCSVFTIGTSCGFNNGLASVNPSGGTGPYTYLWSNGAITQTITGLAAGSYQVTVTDSGSGCTTVCIGVITGSTGLTCTASSTPASCNIANGTASVIVTNGSGNYTYNWSNGGVSPTITGLSAGSYSVTVTDLNTGCMTTCSTTVELINQLSCVVNTTPSTCGLSDGTATVIVSSGSGSYSYLWSNGGTTQTITSLAAGIYTVTVTDLTSSCTTTCSGTVSDSQAISCMISTTNTTCGFNNGTASLTVSGGSGNYSYIWSNGAFSQSLSGLAPGTYSVTVTDIVTSCTTVCSGTVAPSTPLTCTVNGTDGDCGLNNGIASVNVFNGSGNYSYVWSNGATTSVVTNLATGGYTVTVVDLITSCTTSCSVSIVNSGGPTCSITGTDATCGYANGAASVLVMNGVAPYSFLWSNGATTQNLSGLTSGIYTLTVTDFNGCSSTCSVDIDDTALPTCTINGTSTSCGLNNGAASVFGMGGSGVYSYVWSTGATTNTISGLASGTYTATVTDTNGCTSSCSVFIADSQPLACEVSTTHTNCGFENGTASVSVYFGSGNYSYTWSNGATTSSISGLAGGTYTVTVVDNVNYCTSVCTGTVDSSTGITCTVTATQTTCGLSNGTATANVFGGSGNFSYMWNTGATTSVIGNLSAGTYIVTVIDNITGCTSSCNTVIEFSNAPSCYVNTTPTSCGQTNGTATVNVTGGSGNYSYTWSNGATTSTIGGLGAGLYSVTVVDNIHGCTTTCSGTVSESNPITCSVSTTPANCGQSNGTATVYTSGGSGTYSYSWSNGGTSQTISGLSDGSYSVTVVDVSSGCSTVCSGVVGSTNPISCTVSTSPTSCGYSNGSATVNVSGGSGNYSYTWSNGGTTQTITGLSAGTYIVTVVDNQSSCFTVCSGIVSSSNPISCTVSTSPTSCGYSNGSATVNVSGGSGSYSYTWSNGGTTQTISGLSAGTYTVTVVDNEGSCSTVCSGLVSSSSLISCSVTTGSTSCGQSNGTATAFVTGGSGNYSYNWSNGATSQSITGLTSGTYTVTVVDNIGGCTSVCSGFVASSNTINCNVISYATSCGLNNGSASANVTGGSGNYSYSWSNGQTTSSISNLAPGTYIVTVTDNNGGCITICSGVVSGSNPITCNVSVVHTSCGINNGIATANVNGGSGDYSYVWSNGATTQTISGLAAGSYTVTITDNINACITTCSGTIDSSVEISCYTTTTPTSCGLDNGSVIVSVTGGSGNYNYAWSNGGTTQLISGLSTGVYTVTVTDMTSNCTSVCTGIVTGTPSISCYVTTNSASCGLDNGSATVTVTGGSGNFSYSWSNGAITQAITGLSAGFYSVTVTDNNGGCTTVCSATITASLPMSCVLNTTPTSCTNATGAATASVTGGSGSYSYLWNTGATTQTIVGLNIGNYSVTVTDLKGGCTSVCSGLVTAVTPMTCEVSTVPGNCGANDGSATVTVVDNLGGCSCLCTGLVEIPGQVECSINSTDSTCGDPNGFATVIPTQGSGVYTYSWSNGGTSQTITGLLPGTYTVTVTDVNGCTTSCSTEIGTSDCLGQIGDRVWEDYNADGIQDALEPGIAGVSVTLWNADTDQVVSVVLTNVEGVYIFNDLPDGNYYVEFGTLPVGYSGYLISPTVNDPALQSVNSDITGANGFRTTNSFYLAIGESKTNIDAGFYVGGVIGNQVWMDDPLTGMPNLFDNTDEPLENVSMKLYSIDTSGTETLVDSTVTDSNGEYQFIGLEEGSYILEADVDMVGQVFVAANAQDSEGNQPDYMDSDIVYNVLEEMNPDGSMRCVGRTDIITIGKGENNTDCDVGLGERTVPIELYDFTAVWNGDKAVTELDWITDVEVNSHFFGIERTDDLNNEFDEIGKVDAAGNSVGTNYYDFEDAGIFEAGTYYYRLRMVDLDGSYSYSKIVVVEVDEAKEEQKIQIAVYPNPVIDELTIEVNLERNAVAEGGIYDAIGQLIRNVDVNEFKAGTTKIKIDTRDLPVGTYLLRMKIDDNVIFEKITRTE